MKSLFYIVDHRILIYSLFAVRPPPPDNQQPVGERDGITISWTPVESFALTNYEVILDFVESGGRRRRQTDDRSPRMNVSADQTQFTFRANQLKANQDYLASVDGILNVSGVVARVAALRETAVTSAEQRKTGKLTV